MRLRLARKILTRAGWLPFNHLYRYTEGQLIRAFRRLDRTATGREERRALGELPDLRRTA